jgi:3-phenylpropionate/trans-cinnamate dioxygenase ferredoxin reductase component
VAARKVDYLLIGGGLASANCARWLRESGADGSVLLVGREPDPPYNRPDCSKGYLRGEEERSEPFFRPDPWWDEQAIELLKRLSVTSLDLAARTAKLSDKQEIEFDKALVATGANVRRLDVPGCELEQVYYLRTLGNADSIRAGVADAQEVVVIGGSYIGCEVSASLTAIGKRCTIVMQESAALERGFGARVGGFIQGLLESVGVTVHGQDELARLEGGDGRVRTVVTRNGLELAADAVVIGAGVTPEVGLAKRAGLATGEHGGVVCSDRLQTIASGVYAAGDICEYDSPLHGRPMRIEHWDVAFNQGKTAALTSRTRRSRISTRCSPASANSNTSGLPCAGTRSSCAAPSRSETSQTGICRMDGSSRRSRGVAPTTSTSHVGCSPPNQCSMLASAPRS